VVTWLLKDVYINGAEFTMGGKKMRLEKIDYPKDETADGDKKKPIKEKKTSHAKVISLSNLKKE